MKHVFILGWLLLLTSCFKVQPKLIAAKLPDAVVGYPYLEFVEIAAAGSINERLMKVTILPKDAGLKWASRIVYQKSGDKEKILNLLINTNIYTNYLFMVLPPIKARLPL